MFTNFSFNNTLPKFTWNRHQNNYSVISWISSCMICRLRDLLIINLLVTPSASLGTFDSVLQIHSLLRKRNLSIYSIHLSTSAVKMQILRSVFLYYLSTYPSPNNSLANFLILIHLNELFSFLMFLHNMLLRFPFPTCLSTCILPKSVHPALALPYIIIPSNEDFLL